MNEYDSNRIYDYAKKINYSKTSNVTETDCYVLNTCHIREKATEKVSTGSSTSKMPEAILRIQTTSPTEPRISKISTRP